MLNVAYSPKQNPIEIYFSMIKRNYRKFFLRNFANKFTENSSNQNQNHHTIDSIVEESFKKY